VSAVDNAMPVDAAALHGSRKSAVDGRRDTTAASERTRWAPVVVGIAITGWFAALLALGLVRHAAHLTGRYDHGNMVQTIWNTAHGHFLELTFQNGEQMSRLGAHADVFLALLAPLWLVAPSPVTLIVVQVAAVALGALPVFWLARKHIGSETGAVAMVFAYLLYPWVAWGALEDFHSVTVAIGLLLFAIWALDADRLGLFAVFAGLALTTHELVGLHIMGLGIWYAFARRHRIGGAVIAVAGLTWSAVFVGLVIPAFAGGTNVFYGRFESVGGSPSGILQTLFSDPTQVLGAVATGRDYIYLFLLLVPLGALWIYSPWMALVATPQISVNLLSDWEASTSPKVHYTSAIIPFLIVATVFGAARFSPGKARGAVIAAVVAALFTLVAAPRPSLYLGVLDPAPREALREAAALVPADARVSATEGLGARLSDRRVIYSFPMISDAEWVVLDRRDSWLPDLPTVKRGDMPVAFARAVKRFEADPRFHSVFDRDGVAVFRREA
jgi:uncharacterized membrane protein